MNRENFEKTKNQLLSLLIAQGKFNRIDCLDLDHGLTAKPENFSEIFPSLPQDIAVQIGTIANELLDKKIIDVAGELLNATYETDF